MIRTGFWGLPYYNCSIIYPKPYSNYKGPYIRNGGYKQIHVSNLGSVPCATLFTTNIGGCLCAISNMELRGILSVGR